MLPHTRLAGSLRVTTAARLHNQPKCTSGIFPLICMTRDLDCGTAVCCGAG
jgi:hypothetical protein